MGKPKKTLEEKRWDLVKKLIALDQQVVVSRDLPMTIGVTDKNVGITINPDFTWEFAKVPESMPLPDTDITL